MFRFQDPKSDRDPQYLLEAISAACGSGSRGAGVFAFASSAGIDFLISDAEFREFLAGARFDLIVGIDAVTNTAALDRLAEAVEEFPGLSVRVFLNEEGSLFHPKLCWFKTNLGGTVLVGSGNLTPGGLMGNWEAYAVLDLGEREFRVFEGRWESWRTANGASLRVVGDEEVRERAARNRVLYHGAPRATGRAQNGRQAGLQEVLIAEIPGGGNRWQQGNFSQSVYTGFFGADLDNVERLFIEWVDDDGAVIARDIRQTVTRKSMNYGFEHTVASGLPYPSGDERPIGVYQKTGARSFRCLLRMPGSSGYATARVVLERQLGPFNSRRMRRVVLRAFELRELWPDCPLFKRGNLDDEAEGEQ